MQDPERLTVGRLRGTTSVWHPGQVSGPAGAFPGSMPRNDTRWSWVSVISASGGSVAGVLVGAGVSVLVARALGSQSLADYGPAFVACIATACAFGLVGCSLALRAAGDSRVITTVAILAVMLPGSAWAFDPVVTTLARTFRWTFGVAIPVAIVLLPLFVVLPAIVARMVAGLFPCAARLRDRR